MGGSHSSDLRWLELETEGASGQILRGYDDSGASQVALVVKNPPANTGDKRDMGSIPGLGRSPGGEHGNSLQYSSLGNLKDRGSSHAMYGP